MRLQTMLPLLVGFRAIVVTGPQRSGTTIAANIIAKELGFRAILEESFREDNIVAFGAILARRRRIVVQAPALSCIVHLLKPKDIAVVFMMRKTKDIIASETRIDWTRGHADYEKAKYLRRGDKRPISRLKQVLWRSQQAARLGERGFTLDYESLSCHPLWLEKTLRASFHPRQTTL